MTTKFATEFQFWLNTVHNGEFLEEIRLAKQLYDDVVLDDEPPSLTTAEDIEREWTSAPANTNLDLSTLVRWHGIRGDWFVSVFCQHPYIQRLMEFGCELWFVRKVCIPELLRRHGVLSGACSAHVDKLKDTATADAEPSVVAERATVFLSYTGAHSLRHFIDLVEQNSLGKEYVWMDIFCVDQFAWSGHKDNEQMKQFKIQLQSDIVVRIKQINCTVLMVDSWKDIMTTLSKTWVLWEIFNTAAGKSNFRLLLSEADRDNFLYALYGWDQSQHCVMEALRAIDVEKSIATSEAERTSIISKLRELGFHSVNTMVSEQIREWVMAEAEKELCRLGFALDTNNEEFQIRDASIQDDDPPMWTKKRPSRCFHGNILEEKWLSEVHFVRRLGDLRLDHGMTCEAERLYRKAREMCQLHDAHGWIATNDSLDLCLMGKGAYSEAEVVIREKLKHLRKQSLDEIKTQLRLEEVRKKQGKPIDMQIVEDTLQSYREMLDRPVRECKSNEDMNELGDKWKQFAEATKMKVTIVKLARPINDDMVDADILRAQFLEDNGEAAEAEKIYRRCIGYKVQCGLEDANGTVAMKLRLAFLLRKTGNMREATAIFATAVVTLEKTMGKTHPRTLHVRMALADTLWESGDHETAEGVLKQGLEFTLDEDNDQALMFLDNLGAKAMLREDDDDLDDAKLYLKKALTLSCAECGRHHVRTAEREYKLALCLLERNESFGAHQLLQHAQMILPKDTEGLEQALSRAYASAMRQLLSQPNDVEPSYLQGESAFCKGCTIS